MKATKLEIIPETRWKASEAPLLAASKTDSYSLKYQKIFYEISSTFV